jgi:Rrf2 family protein
MLDVAQHGSAAPVPRSEIATRQELSPDYVAHLFRQLRGAGLVLGVKGPSGGYSLARSPEEIRVGEIVRAVEGPIAAVDCVLAMQEYPCQRLDHCVAHQVWMRLSATIEEFLDSISLADLCDDARKLAVEAVTPTDSDSDSLET